jgi:hypothetical protein
LSLLCRKTSILFTVRPGKPTKQAKKMTKRRRRKERRRLQAKKKEIRRQDWWSYGSCTTRSFGCRVKNAWKME